MPVAPNREFWMHVLEEKIKATIGNEGDMIGWPSDKESVGPIAFAAKQVPSTSRSIYTASRYTRPFFVSFGSRTRRLRDTQYNHCEAAKWRTYYHLAIRLETACIWPAVLSDPLVAVCPVDLHVTAAGFPMISRIPSDATEADGRMHERWATHYVKVSDFTWQLQYNRSGENNSIQYTETLRGCSRLQSRHESRRRLPLSVVLIARLAWERPGGVLWWPWSVGWGADGVPEGYLNGQLRAIIKTGTDLVI